MNTLIIYRLLLFLMCFTITFLESTPRFTLILDPAGDSKEVGRIIHDEFERSLTLSFAHELKRVLLEEHPLLNVIVSPSAGKAGFPFQTASQANSMGADLVITLHCYESKEIKPCIDIYHYWCSSDFPLDMSSLAFYDPADAPRFNKQVTQEWTTFIASSLKSHYSSALITRGPYALPFKPLLGIIPPACTLEIGIKEKNDLLLCITPLAKTLTLLATSPAQASS